jgi:methionine aminopeptidase
MIPSIQTYKVCDIISRSVYKELKDIINNGKELCVPKLCDIANDMLIQKCEGVVKENKFTPHKQRSMYLGFPCCISLNNCVGSYNFSKDQQKYNTINPGDVVKIEIGANINGCIAQFGDTFVYNAPENCYVKLLDKLEKAVLSELVAGNINDDVKIKVESICSTNDCFPVENAVSYQAQHGFLKTQTSKYIILNYQKYYDDEDSLVGEPNMCFDLEEGEMYVINLSIAENNDSTLQNHTYYDSEPAHVYNFNDYFYNLKLKASKEFYSKVKSQHANNGFYLKNYNDNPKLKLGFKEVYQSGIIDEHPVLFLKDGSNVYFRKFLAIVGKECGVKLGEA